MGRFSTTVQVKDSLGRIKFVNSFCEMMKKRGFVPCSEDEAALSYLLVFGEGGWVTLANEEYNDNPKKAYEDSREMAATLKTSAFSVEVVDSDFAFLKLNAPSGDEDELVVGDGSGYGIEEPTRGTQKLWQPLLANGNTWEQFCETAAKNATFVEYTLVELAQVLGIESYYIDADYNEVLDKADENKNISAFYFKKAAENTKTMSLNAAFKQVFGEGLEPLGYKLIKGSKLPYFVRVVNDEIIHFITFCNTAPDGRGCNGIKYKCFSVLCGVSTVYNSELDFDTDPEKFHLDFINNISEIYAKNHRNDYDVNFSASIREFYYNPKSAEEMFGAFESALKVTKEIAMPVINQAVTLEKCMDYFEIMGHSVFLPFGNTGEGLLCTKLFSANEYVMFKDRSREREIKECRRELDLNSNLSPKRQKSLEERINYIMARREEDKKKDYDVFTNPELQDKAPANLERRRKENIEKLRDYGLEI